MTWQHEKAFRLSLWRCERAGSQATRTFPHHERGACHSWETAGAQRPSALANRAGGPACSTLGPNSQEGLIRQHSPTWGTPGPVCPAALASCPEQGTAFPVSWRNWVPTSDSALFRPVLLSSSTGPTPLRGTFNANGLLAPSNLSGGSIAHPDSPLHISAPGACPTNTSHGVLTARAMQEGKQGPWQGKGASSKGHKKRSTRTKAKNPPTRQRSKPPWQRRAWLPADGFCDNLGAGRAQTHAPSPRPQEDRPVHDQGAWCRAGDSSLFHSPGRESGGRARRWVPKTRRAWGASTEHREQAKRP
ncbi:uncharacterized protein LOC116645435 [Phoca vitulina]|uniref:uncharacterized protein LOC116645435 n=1 Tax=Phoca vitulina TaxID=9720 RepID=UPI0013964C4A|nr:uncharacterized protein LOC116645435 [Phoca vitulina]